MVSLFRRKRGGNEKQEQSPHSHNDRGSGTGTPSHGPEIDSPKKTSTHNSRSSRSNSSQTKGSSAASETETTTFRVKIPPNVKPGKEFHVYAGTRKVKLICPKGAKPGQSLAVTLPKEKQIDNRYNGPNGSNVKLIPDTDPPAYLVTIPPNIRGGQKFPTLINGVNMMVTSPPNATPGMDLRIVPPPPPKQETRRSTGQKFEVVVPENVQPGESFSIMAGGIRVMIQCPNNAKGGQMVRFHLPLKGSKNVVKKLEYDADGWARTLQVAQMKFQWTKVTKKHKTYSNSIQKTLHQNAYVRHISKNGVELIPAQCELADCRLVSEDGYELISCSELIEIQTMALNKKVEAFHTICKAIGRAGEGKGSHLRIKVRRDHLLQDSMHSIMILNPSEMRRLWRVQFVGEEGIDAGGLKREWFQLISEELFNLDTGLWMTCGENQMNMQIHPSSGLLNEDHLIYFRFLGRIIGKALYDGELVTGHLVQTFYKHLLGWPVTFSDLEHLDPAYYKSIKALMDMDDIEYACLDFTISEEILGSVETVDLIPNGADVDVTNDNVVRYLEAVLNYRLVGRIKLQLKELLQGFLDVIPSALTTIFDFQELELILCGMPNIDLDDWMENTEYSGTYHAGSNDENVVWFWEVVREMDEEKKARLLQFVTGTCGVPHKGFAILKGNDGGVRKFTIHGVKMEGYPRAHTCFNRIDLPMYNSKVELKEKLETAITMVSTGFDLE